MLQKVFRDCFGRPISRGPELAEIIASERWETDPSLPEVPSRLLSSHSWKKVMADKCFFDDDILRLEALVEAAERSTHSQPVYDCRILLLSHNLSIVLCSNRGRSRAPRSDVLHRCVWRATSGSASAGYRASSTAVTGAAKRMTAHVILPRVPQTTSIQLRDRRSRYLTHGSVVNLAANTKRGT